MVYGGVWGCMYGVWLNGRTVVWCMLHGVVVLCVYDMVSSVDDTVCVVVLLCSIYWLRCFRRSCVRT